MIIKVYNNYWVNTLQICSIKILQDDEEGFEAQVTMSTGSTFALRGFEDTGNNIHETIEAAKTKFIQLIKAINK